MKPKPQVGPNPTPKFAPDSAVIAAWVVFITAPLTITALIVWLCYKAYVYVEADYQLNPSNILALVVFCAFFLGIYYIARKTK
jgi:hypothetical protein